MGRKALLTNQRTGDERLSQRARKHIDGPLPLFYCTLSFWKIALKRAGSRFEFEIESDWDVLLPVNGIDFEGYNFGCLQRHPDLVDPASSLLG